MATKINNSEQLADVLRQEFYLDLSTYTDYSAGEVLRVRLMRYGDPEPVLNDSINLPQGD